MTPVIFPNFNSKPKASSSGVYMSAVEVVRLADNARDWCNKMKAKRRQELIDAEKRSIIKKREKSANRFWNRWLGRSDVGKPLPTDKEIWAELDRSGGGDHIRFGAGFWIDLQYSKIEDVAERLLRTAAHGKEVFVIYPLTNNFYRRSPPWLSSILQIVDIVVPLHL